MSIRHDYFFKSSRISRRFRVCGSSLWFPLTCSLKGTGRLGWSLGLVDGPGWSWGLVETSPNSWNSMITLAQGPMCVFSFHDKLLMCFWLKRIVRHGILSTHNTLGCILWGEVCLLWQCIHKSIYIYIYLCMHIQYIICISMESEKLLNSNWRLRLSFIWKRIVRHHGPFLGISQEVSIYEWFPKWILYTRIYPMYK